MKPRTKLQREVMRLSNNLNPEARWLLNWAKVECLEHRGYETKRRVICMDCGETFSPALVSRKRATCPHCGTRLKVEKSRKRTDEQRIYFAKAEIVGEFQVIRNFELSASYGVGEPAYYSCYEILQHWIREDGKREVVARNHTTNWYCDSWSGSLEIRDKNYRGRYYQSANKYDVYPCKYHPKSKFKALYRKYGIDKNLQELTALEAIYFVPENSRAETLLKAKQYGLLGFALSNRGVSSRYWASMKICIRNNYKVKDAGMWTDYIDLLRYFNKDTRNAHYVCPKNLKQAHDYWMDRKRKVQEKEKEDMRRQKLLKDQEKFSKMKSKFFGIAFSDKDLKVRVLESVREIMEEGDSLHHCVFTNEYHLEKDSLILSATVNGKKVETVEVSIKKMEVVQARGLHNKNSEYHDRIVALVNRNIPQIQELL